MEARVVRVITPRALPPELSAAPVVLVGMAVITAMVVLVARAVTVPPAVTAVLVVRAVWAVRFPVMAAMAVTVVRVAPGRVGQQAPMALPVQ
jgi:hypothetical protein